MSITETTNFKTAIDSLKSKYQLEYVRELGKGTYGIVVSMIDRVRKKDVAVKIVTKPKRAELTEWPQLLHPNIIPLYSCYQLENGFTAFVMPHMRCNIMSLVNSQPFRLRTTGLGQVTKWMSQLLCGINYLHLRHLYHLDVKLGNELISYNLTALLCDFSFLTSKHLVSVKYIGMPDVYRPREVCLFEETHTDLDEPKFDSQRLDLWGFGITCLEAFTNQRLYMNPRRSFDDDSSQQPVWRGWEIEVQWFLTRIRQDSEYFLTLMQDTFPSSMARISDAKLCLEFVEQFLKDNPQSRVPANEALEHRFLNTWSRQV